MGRCIQVVHNFLEGGGRGFPEFSAELLSVDDGLEVFFDSEGLDFELLCGQEAIGEQGEVEFVA